MEGQEITITIRKSSAEANKLWVQADLDGRYYLGFDHRGTVKEALKVLAEDPNLGLNATIASDWSTRFTR